MFYNFWFLLIFLLHLGFQLIAMFHLLLLWHRLRTLGFSVLQTINRHSHAFGGSLPTPLLFYPLFPTIFFVAEETAVKAQPHVSLQILTHHIQRLFFVSAITIDRFQVSFHCGSHCRTISHQSSLESFWSYVQLEWTVISAMFRHMFF